MIGSLVERALYGLRRQKLSQDIAWSLGSFAVLAISGIVINIVITALRDAAALGVFNIAYAVYIIASQFAVWGMHYSVLRHAAYYADDAGERGRMLMTAVACTLAMGLVAAAVVAAGEPLFAWAFSSQTTGGAIRNAACGLLLFPVNKVLLAYLNGLRLMKAYSIIQAARYLMLMALVSGLAASSLPIETTSFGFLLAELGTALLVVAYLTKCRLAQALSFSLEWRNRHFRFGTKGLMAGMFAEVNSRVDVLMIGFFLSDRATGIYSFAAMLVDGLYHVLAMIRLNFNPILVAAVRDRDWELAMRLRAQACRLIVPVAILLAITLLAAYYVLAASVISVEKGLLAGLPSLAILLAGVTAISFLVPFDNLMMVSGHPGYQTVQQLATVGANILVAALLLPLLGIEGAAIGTAASYFAGIAVLVVFSHRLLGWNLLSNTVKG